MKKAITLIIAGMLIASLGFSAYAAEGDSAEKPGEIKIIDVVDGDGEDISSYLDVVDNEESKEVKKEVNQEVIKDVLGDDYDPSLYIDGAYDILYSDDNYPITITFDYSNVTEGDVIYILQKTEDGWERIECVVKDGKITATFKNENPFVLVREENKSEGSKDSQSPKTGYNTALIGAAAVLSLAGAAYATKRAVDENN